MPNGAKVANQPRRNAPVGGPPAPWIKRPNGPKGGGTNPPKVWKCKGPQSCGYAWNHFANKSCQSCVLAWAWSARCSGAVAQQIPKVPQAAGQSKATKPKWVKGQWWDYGEAALSGPNPAGSKGAGGTKPGGKASDIKVPDDDDDEDMFGEGAGEPTPATPGDSAHTLEAKLKQLVWVFGTDDHPECRKLQTELDARVLSDSAEAELRKVAKLDSVPLVTQMQRKCQHLAHLAKRTAKVQTNLDGLEVQQQALDKLKADANERMEKLVQQTNQSEGERISLNSALERAAAATGADEVSGSKDHETGDRSDTGSPTQHLILPTHDLVNKFKAHLPEAGDEMAEIFKQFQCLKEQLEADLSRKTLLPKGSLLPTVGLLVTPPVKPTGADTSGTPPASGLAVVKTDQVRDRTRSPDSKRRATGEKGEDMEA